MRPRNFICDGYYHIGNRGIAGAKIYKDLRDQLRFLAMLSDFNTTANVEMRFAKTKARLLGLIPGLESPLVDLIAYCLMPNHFHLIVRQKIDNGVPKFMQKIGTGYTMYFNKRHKSFGHLFQSKFFSKPITTDEQLLHTTAYIHLNPVKKSKNGSIYTKKISEQQMFLIKNYQWSSLSDYIENDEHQDLEIRLIKPKIDKKIITGIINQEQFDYWKYITEVWSKNTKKTVNNG